MSTSTDFELKPALIYEAKIAVIDSETYTVRVHSRNGISDPIGLPSLYMHAQGEGEGIHFMPEIGSSCMVIQRSDGKKQVIPTQYVPAVGSTNKGADFSNGRPRLKPGDIHISTRDHNKIEVLRGGRVVIEATPLCKEVFEPKSHTKLLLSKNTKTTTMGGEEYWYTLPTALSSTGVRPTVKSLKVYEYAEDSRPCISMKMGFTQGPRIIHHQAPPDTGEISDRIFDFSIIEKPNEANTTSLDLGMDKQGDIDFKFYTAVNTFTSITNTFTDSTNVFTGSISFTGPLINMTVPTVNITGALTITGAVLMGSFGVAAPAPGLPSPMSIDPAYTQVDINTLNGLVVGDELAVDTNGDLICERLIKPRKFFEELDKTSNSVLVGAFVIDQILDALDGIAPGTRSTVETALDAFALAQGLGSLSIDTQDVIDFKQGLADGSYLANKIKSE